MKTPALIVLFIAALAVVTVPAQSIPTDTFAGLRARSIGPAVTSGRVMTIAVNPANHAEFYVGAASGGVWKTVNGGASFQPVFDTQGSYSIGWVTIDPKRPSIVWVGTGERNSQRSVAYGDGVYKSEDGGRSWTNVGLKILRAHRPHRHRSEGQRHRLRRRAGTALGARRRPRPLQDDRRRQDLESGAEDLREHRRQRRRARSAQPGRHRRRVVPAPPHRFHA